ncbi:hypothetical protein L7F22_007233 [Adiantum nelumboides]|nr:hypothetical protein [Adiantum nelumboides]
MLRCRMLARHLQVDRTAWRAHLSEGSRAAKDCSGDPCFSGWHMEIVTEIRRLQEMRSEFSHHASVSYWISKADWMNRDFFVTHRERPAGSTMRAIRDAGGVLHTDLDRVLGIALDFYEDLFTADPGTVQIVDARGQICMLRCRMLARHLQVDRTAWRAHLSEGSRAAKFFTLEVRSLQNSYGGRRYFGCLIDQTERSSKQEEALQATLKEISKNFGVEAVTWLGRASTAKSISVIPTGSLTLDCALGIGGLPKGRIVEIFGPEGSGKTTLALHVIAEAQKVGGQCVFIDSEHSLDCAQAEALGADVGSLLVARPDSLEAAFTLVNQFAQSKTVDVIVVDNVAKLFHKAEVTEEANTASQARLFSQTLRKLTHSISVNKVLLTFLSQTRSKIRDHGFMGREEITPGGYALKCYSSVRLNVQKAEQFKTIHQSNTVVKVVKNKLAPPFKTAEFEIESGRGISKEGEVLDQAVKHGAVEKSGSLFFYNGTRIGDGRDNAKKFLRGDVQLQETLAVCIKESLARGGKEP